MAPTSHMFYASSPTLLLPPQVPAQSAFNHEMTPDSELNRSFSFGNSAATSEPWQQSKSYTAMPPSRSRKRSCDEMASPPEDPFSEYEPPTPKPEPIYGEGMTLISASGFSVDAASQTGTWAEERAESQPPESPNSSNSAKPTLISRKSQRLDLSSTPILEEDPILSTGSPPKNHSTEPTIDECTQALGIGWSKLSEDTDIQAAARGWAKYVENHYQITGAKLLLQSRSHESYLVGAQEGFFLFHEDLNQGRLVGRTWTTTLANLKMSPIGFEGHEVLRAVITPSAVAGLQQNGMIDHAMIPEPAIAMSHETSMDID